MCSFGWHQGSLRIGPARCLFFAEAICGLSFQSRCEWFRPGDSGDRDPLVTVPWPIRAVISHIDLSKQVEHNPGILNQTQPRSRANIVRRRACRRNKQPLLAWGLRLDLPELSFNRLIHTIPNAALVRLTLTGGSRSANKLAY